MSVGKVLIYRLGSLGDTVVALPSLHLVARTFPNAERRVLTNFPVNGKATPLESVLDGSGLVHGYFRYPLGTRNPRALWSLRRQIRHWSPDVLVYLAEPRGAAKTWRDALFFRSCGIRQLIGVPDARDQRERRKRDGADLFESEAGRLARCIGELGEIDLDAAASWDLHLSEAEEQAAGELVWPKTPYMAVSVGTKTVVKDWGEHNWASLLARLSPLFPDLGLVMVGAQEERALSDRAASGWSGPKRNLCGVTVPRISAAVIKNSILFIGHDSGPMHLAAATGVPCVAIFSGRNRPGEWFPPGARHHVLYHQTDCSGCRLDSCSEHQKKCITTISVQEVFDAVCRKIGDQRKNAGR